MLWGLLFPGEACMQNRVGAVNGHRSRWSVNAGVKVISTFVDNAFKTARDFAVSAKKFFWHKVNEGAISVLDCVPREHIKAMHTERQRQ